MARSPELAWAFTHADGCSKLLPHCLTCPRAVCTMDERHKPGPPKRIGLPTRRHRRTQPQG